MSGRLALQIDAAARRVAELEHALQVYREGWPAAAARVGTQLDEAHLELTRLEASARAQTNLIAPAPRAPERGPR